MSLESLRTIFGIVWAKTVPECYLSWLGKLLRDGIWRLRVIPFKPLNCKIVRRDEESGAVYECGFSQYGKLGSFRHGIIRKGHHGNLHQVIHCLHDFGVSFDHISVEQCFMGHRVDVLAEVANDKHIVVELGELTSAGKFRFATDELVSEFWFDGFSDKCVYRLSQMKPLEFERMFKSLPAFMGDYFRAHCRDVSHLGNCMADAEFSCLGSEGVAEACFHPKKLVV